MTLESSTRPLIAPFWIILIALITGCEHQGGDRVYTADRWRESSGALGKVTIIVVRPERFCNDPSDGNDVAKAVKEALNKLPDTTALEPKPGNLWIKDITDSQAIASAKADGAQTVCVLVVGQYTGQFTIGLPILWCAESQVTYSLRLLDVVSGNLLAHCVSYRQMGGWFEICNPADKEASLKTLLKRDLTPPKPISS